MKFEVSASDFSTALSKATSLTSTRTTLPILSGVYLSAQGESLEIKSTNLQASFRTLIPCSVDEAGEVVVAAAQINKWVSSRPNSEKIKAQLKDGRLRLRAGRSSSAIPIFTDEYPFIPDSAPETPWMETDISHFRAAVLNTTISAPSGEASGVPSIMGIRAEGNAVTMLSWDGFRLSKNTIETQNNVSGDWQAISAPALKDAIKCFAGISGTLLLEIKNGKATMAIGETVVAALMQDAQIPDYNMLFDETKSKIVVNTQSFLDALKRSQIFARRSTDYTWAKFYAADNTLTVLAEDSELGESKEILDATITVAPSEFAINLTYLIEALQTVITENAILEYVGNAIWVRNDIENDPMLHVIMRMAIDAS